jgi:hypothetical protein
MKSSRRSSWRRSSVFDGRVGGVAGIAARRQEMALVCQELVVGMECFPVDLVGTHSQT